MKESENFLFCQNLLSMNSFTLPLVGNSTTLNCPPLTQPTADGYACEYTTWAYALFAIVAIIIAGIPFVVFVCYVHRKVKKKKQEARARGRGYSGSFESSSPYPYQPLNSDASGQNSYGALDRNTDQSLRSPSDASTVSLAESRASVVPNYDEVSLNHRNAAANKTPTSGTNRTAGEPAGQRSSKSPHIPSNNQEKLVDQGGQFYDSVDVVSDVPKGPKQSSAKPSRQQHGHDVYSSVNKNPVYDDVERQHSSNATYSSGNKSPIYDEVEGSDRVDAFQALSVNVPETNAIPENPKSAIPYEGTERTKGNDDERSPQYAVLEDSRTKYSNEDVNNKEQKSQCNSKQMQCSPKQTCDSPPYAVLENPNGDLPNDRDPDQKQESYFKEQEQGLPSDDDQQETDPLTAVAVESPPSEKDITVLPPTPPKQNGVPSENTGLLESLENSDQMSPRGKSAAKSRTDYEELLLEKVRTMPAKERNGTFLIRDSNSTPDSKVLTMYAWKVDSSKEVYNFKVSLTENGQVYLRKSARKFSNIGDLLEYLRRHKDMLPCVLQTQVFP